MPGGLPLYRAAVEPSIQPAKDAIAAARQGRYGDAADSALSAIPVVGPLTGNFQAEANKQGLLPAVAGAGVDYLTGKAIAGGVKAAIKPGTMVPGENYTQGQHASFSGVLARGSGAGKGFFPKDVATDIGSATRQAAADNPAINPATAATPEESLARTQAVLAKVRQGIDAQHAQALQPVANTPISPKPIQDAVSFPSSLKGFAPQDAAAVADLRNRLGNVTTLGGLNDLRQYLNTELSNQFKLSNVAAGNSGAVTSAMQDALKATRDLYYKELEKATGQNFQGAKRMESSVLKAEEALQNSAPGMAAKQAIAEQPRGIKGNAADIIQGANTLKGGPIQGAANFVANRILGETPMTPIQNGLQSFFSDLPARSPAQVSPQVIPPAGPPGAPQLQAPGQPQLPAPAQVAPAYSPRPQLAGAPPVQQIGAPQTPLQLGAGEGNPEFVTPPASYPPLNEPTAQTSVNAGTPRPVQEEIPQRTINVSPEGTAAIQRPALPPPATHAFDAQKWAQEHPNGNLKTAITQAKSKGFRVINEPTASPPQGTPNPALAAGDNTARSGGQASRASDLEMSDEHMAADERSEEENLARAAHTQTVQIDGENILRVNDDAHSYLDKADNSGSAFAKIWNADQADDIENALRTKARRMGRSGNQLWKLADAIRDGRTSGGGLITVRDRFTPGNGLESNVAHELFHAGQMANGLDEGASNERLFKGMQAANPQVAKLYSGAANRLWSMGRYGKSEIYTEVPAWIASGDYNVLGLTLKNAGKLLSGWLEEARKSGADLSKFRTIDPRVAKEIDYENRFRNR
jgi:hypothetical protein